MPWSVYENVAPIINEVARLNPARMIELGIGFGKYGALCREVLDGRYGRCARESWEHQIAGVEVFHSYKGPAWECYSWVDGRDFRQDWNGWDLVLMVDSLEHLERADGKALLEKLMRDNKHVIISVPNGPCPQPEAMCGNEHEIHRATWYPHDFTALGGTILHQGYCVVASIPGRG